MENWRELGENFWIENSLNWLVVDGELVAASCKTDKKESLHAVYSSSLGYYVKHFGRRYYL
jgi:hypothetical protein